MLPHHLHTFTRPIPVLDHGFVRLVDVMGDDGAIVEAARMSTTGQRSPHVEADMPNHNGEILCTVCGRGRAARMLDPDPRVCLEGDRRLIRYMARSGHTSPFEMCEIKLHVKLPIFVARQWIRHRTWSFNEFSGRYSEMPDETFRVAPDAWRAQDTVNKQGSTGVVHAWPPGWSYVPVEKCNLDDPTEELAWELRDARGVARWFPAGADGAETMGDCLSDMQVDLQDAMRSVYSARLAAGVSKELARIDLGLGQYTEWTCKVDLHNLVHFLKLRLDEHAQPEIRVYAEVIRDIVAAWVPIAWEALRDWRVEGAALSRQQIRALRVLVNEVWTDPDGGVDVRRVLAHALEHEPRAEYTQLLALLGVK